MKVARPCHEYAASVRSADALAGGGSDGESAALSYSNNSSSRSMTTLAAPRSLSWGRAWLAFSALGSNSISLPNPRESTAISEDLRGGGAELQHVTVQSLGSGERGEWVAAVVGGE